MFATNIYPTKDSKLNTYIKDFFIGMIEIAALNNLRDEDPEEYLDGIFPRSFIRRNAKKAVEIIYDLDDIARSDIVRTSLPPIHIYAMYNIIRYYEELKEDLGKSEYDLEIERYIKENYSREDSEWYCSLFNSPSENFVENYGDEYIWFDLWEYKFMWLIDNEKTLPVLTPEAEEMLQLMPNDIINQWELKKSSENMPPAMYNEYDFFISHATEDKKEVAEPLALELKKKGAKVWLDKFEMTVGSSLRSSIDYGIAHSKHGVIILSRDYMRKFWTEKEMNAFFSKLRSTAKTAKFYFLYGTA